MIDNLVLETHNNYSIAYLYQDNMLKGFKHIKSDGSYNIYFYVRNSFRDIVEILDEHGNSLVHYLYDAFGNILETVDNSNDNIGSINPYRYRGYYFDAETQLFYCYSRYYSPKLFRFISPDSIENLDPCLINGLNLYCYCLNNPIVYVDPSGHFVITAAMIWTAIGIGAAIGAGMALASTIVKDLKNGKLFDGDVTLLSYIGNTLGGLFAGAGIGFCSVLGAGLGAALYAGGALTIGGTAISGGAALAMGVGAAFVTGGLGYAIKTGISDQEGFEWSDMFIEAGANAISGLLSFVGGIAGGYFGFKIPGKLNFENFLINQVFQFAIGVYPMKLHVSSLKNRLKELY